MAVVAVAPAAAGVTATAAATATATATVGSATRAVFRCLDRDACFVFDTAAPVARLAHDANDGDCSCDGRLSSGVQYLNRNGHLSRISIERAEELMQCTYTNRLVFQRAHVLRNYAFWGFTPAASGGFGVLATATSRSHGSVSPRVAIGHVASLEQFERTALGLFASASIADGEYIGEYTGVVQVDLANECGVRDDAVHDAYGMCYPSVFEGGQLYLTANEHGNELRCVNHSTTPNVRFTPLLHDDDGLLHVDCFAVRAIAAGEQLFVDYGPTYWTRAGIEPLVRVG